MLRAVLQTTVLMLFLAAVLFGAAGTIDWPMAWAFLGAYLLSAVLGLLLLDPDLIRERSRPAPGAERTDIVLASAAFVWLYPLPMFVAGVDTGRFHWSPPMPLISQFAAFAVFVGGHGFSFWAILSNPFFADFVRIQTERGHHVITAGPYGYVRHPGYAGAILSCTALPLALGSVCALIPAFVGACLLTLRAAREDRTLRSKLPGYTAYSARVPWRLLPGVW